MTVNERLVRALNARKNVSAGNTTITQHGTHADVRLYDTLIARVEYVGTAWVAEPILEAFQRWPSMLTSNRLRLLGIKAHIKNRASHIDGVPVSTLILQRGRKQ